MTYLYSAGTESGPSSCRTAVNGTSEVGVSGGSWERSSEHLLTVGETTSGLVSQDSVLCSEVAVMIVVAILGRTGSNSSSSSSRMGDSWMLLKASGYCLAIFPFSVLILLKMLSRSFFISTRVRVWRRKRSFICCSRTFDSPLKLISISLVFSKRSSMCLWAWMMALTSSELTMLSILLQNTPDAVDSTMMKVKKEKLRVHCGCLYRPLAVLILDLKLHLQPKEASDSCV